MRETPRPVRVSEFSPEELFEEALKMDKSGGIYIVLIPAGTVRERAWHRWKQKAQSLGREVLEYALTPAEPFPVADLLQKARRYKHPVVFVDVDEGLFWAELEDASVSDSTSLKEKVTSARRVLQHLNGHRERLSELQAPLFFWLSPSVLPAFSRYAADLFAIRTAVLDLTSLLQVQPTIQSIAIMGDSRVVLIGSSDLKRLPPDELRGRLRLARKALEREQRRSQPNPLRIAHLHQEVGELYLLQKHLDQALDHYQQALRLFRQVGARLGEANTLAALGRLALHEGRDEEARRLLEQAVRLHEAIGSQYDVAADLGNFGLELLRLGRPEEARPYLLQAAEIFDRIGLPQLAEQMRQAAGAVSVQVHPAVARLAPLLLGVVAVAQGQGGQEVAGQVRAALKELAQTKDGRGLAIALQRVLEGERDPQILDQNLDDVDRQALALVLAALQDPRALQALAALAAHQASSP